MRAIAPRLRARRLSLNDKELQLCYAGAVALVVPSRYEGYGLPALEALARGAPLVAADASAIPEVVGKDPATIAVSVAADLLRGFELARAAKESTADAATGPATGAEVAP